MENTNRTKEQVIPAETTGNLSDADLDQVVGGTSNLNLSKSNINRTATSNDATQPKTAGQS